MWLAAAAAAAAVPGARALAEAAGRPRGPNGKIRIGVVGVKGRGLNHVQAYAKMKDAEVAALCDVDDSVVAGALKAASEGSGRRPLVHRDARAMLEDRTLDAVSIATCNHTHALIALWALAAGKHVYVEKPLSHNLREGAALAAAARATGLVVQHGTQSRSSPGLQEMAAFLRAETLGPLVAVRGYCYKRRTSIGTAPAAEVPAGVDYDLWLGPAPTRPFTRNRFHYNWHWHWDYGNGDIGNQGVHEMDRARWGLGAAGHPRRIRSLGGRFGYTDDGETPNTMLTWFDWGSVPLLFEVRGLETPAHRDCKIGVIFDCRDGSIVNPSYESATAFDRDGKTVRTFGGWGDHFRNFLDAVRAGDPARVTASPAEGHLAVSLCHLANASYRTGEARTLRKNESPFGNAVADEAFARMRAHLAEQGADLARTPCTVGRDLAFDGATETIPGHPAADQLLTREYRKPFTLPSFG